MNRQDDTPDDDAELTSYLEGKDGVSAAYRASSAETPPAALDAAILHAARASLQDNAKKPPKAPALRNYYSLAASLMLGMMLGAVLFRGDSEEPAATMVSAPQTPVDLEKTVVLAEDAVADAATAPQPAVPAPQAEAFVAEQTPAIAENAGTPPAQVASTSEFSERTLPPPLPPIVTRNADTANISPFRSEAIAQAARVDDAQEEIVVTGSRIIRLDYRDNQEDWLREMARMSEQLEQATDDLTTLREALELERAEFSAEYPDVRLDQALRELRGQ